jgi:hypothetical protein
MVENREFILDKEDNLQEGRKLILGDENKIKTIFDILLKTQFNVYFFKVN